MHVLILTTLRYFSLRRYVVTSLAIKFAFTLFFIDRQNLQRKKLFSLVACYICAPPINFPPLGGLISIGFQYKTLYNCRSSIYHYFIFCGFATPALTLLFIIQSILFSNRLHEQLKVMQGKP